jgi:ankyrin repeat protein
VRRADKYGTTPLAKACEKGALDAVRRAYEQCPEELDQADHGGFTPLQKASLQGHVPVVKFLLDQNCRIDCCSKEERDTPLIDAVENGHLEVVRLLLNKNVNPHASNIRGNRAIDSIDTSMPNHKEIRAALEEAMARHQVVQEEKEVPGGQPESKVHRARREKGLRPDLLYSELSKDNLLRYSTSGDLEAVGMMLESVKPDNSCVVAAARGGHDVVLNLLLASASEVLEKDPDPAKYRETPMTVAIGRGHLKVIQLLLDQDNFNPCRTTKDGKTYYQLAEERHGPYWQTEYDMLKKRYDEYKAAQKARMLQKQAKAKSSGKLQAKQKESDAPKSPVLMKTKTKAPKPEDESKQKRLLISRESQNKDASKSRRVVDDDTSAASADDAASQPSKPAQRPRTNSSGTKPLRVKAKSDRSPPSSPLLTESKNRTGRKLKDRNHIKSEDMEPSDIDVDKQSTKRRMSSGTQRTSKADTDAKESREVRESREKRIAKRARLEAGAKAKDDAEAREKARAKEAEVRAKEAEEAREQAKVEAEARARQAEIKAREEARRLKRIREEEEREREEREQRLASLPLAIRNAMEKGRDRPLFATDDGRHGIADQFLPIYVYRHKDIVLDDSRGQTPPAPFSEDLWMMSFAAVGILGLPELHLDEFPSWPKLHVTDAQRRDFLRAYDISNLAQAHAWPQGGTEGYDHAWTQARLREAESQFLAMQPLWWVRLDDCARAVAARRDLAPLRLRTFELARPAAAPIDDFWSTFPGSGKATPAITPKRDPGTPVVERAVEALTNGDSAMHVDEA